MTLAFVLSWLLPLAAGAGAWLALNPTRPAGWRMAALGYGLIVGMLLAAGSTALAARAATQHALSHAGPWLAALAILAFVIAWRRQRAAPALVRRRTPPASRWVWALALLALASLAARGWLMAREILLRPTYPWDAWDAWALKSKTWVLLGHYVPFVSMPEWLAHPTQQVYTSVAWRYPSTLAWIQVWFASAGEGWVEPLANLPWLALWIGLLCGHYGQWRALGLGRWPALAGMYALGSLPLLNVHVALAGYADLWIATVFGLAVLAWQRWLQTHERGQLIVALALALMLPLLKLEGAIWLTLFAATMIYGVLPLRRRRWIMVGLLALALVVAVHGVNLPGLGRLQLSRGALDVPFIGHLALTWHHAAFIGVLNSLFVQPNWHLLWWLAPLIVAWRWTALRRQPALRQLGALLFAGIGVLLFLFLFTDAAQWAENYTAVNRLLMHAVPALVTFLMLLLRDVNWRGAPRTAAVTGRA